MHARPRIRDSEVHNFFVSFRVSHFEVSIFTKQWQPSKIKTCAAGLLSPLLYCKLVFLKIMITPYDEKNIGTNFSFTGGYWKVLLARE